MPQAIRVIDKFTELADVDVSSLQTDRPLAWSSSGKIVGTNAALPSDAQLTLLDSAIAGATPLTLVVRDSSGNASFSNIYTKTEVNSLVSGIDLSAYYTKVEANAGFYSRTSVDGLLGGKSNLGHVHVVADVSGLQASLNAKSDVGHVHIVADITGLQSALNAKADTSALHAAVTVGTPNGLSLSGQQLSLAVATGSSSGAMSSAHYSLLNNATSDATASAIVRRDANANITVNGLTANSFVVGSMTTGDIMPSNATRNIGSPSNKFQNIYARELHLDSNTLYIGDTPVIGTDADTVIIRADPNQSINVATSGTGITTVSSVNGAEISVSGLNADVKVQATGSGGRVVMGATNSVSITAPSTSFTGNANVTGTLTAGNLTVSGNLTVQGEVTTLNTATLTVEDNVIVINHGEAGVGVTAGIAGMRVDRGDAIDGDYYFIFDETDDRFKVGKSGQLETLASQPYVSSTVSSLAPNVNLGTANGLSLAGQTLSLAAASTSSAGAMSAADKVKLNSATIAATPDTIVLRDSNGEVAASTVRASYFVGDGSGLTGVASTLDSLSDVAVSAPSDKQVVVYEATTATWKNRRIRQSDISADFSVSGFSVSVGTGPECGQSFANPTVSVSYAGDSAVAATVTNNDGKSAVALSSPYTSGTLAGHTYTKSVYGQSITWTVTANSADATGLTRTYTATFLMRRYWGVGAAGGNTEAFVKALSGNELTNGRAKTFSITAGAGQKVYYCCKTSFGTPTFTVGGFSGGFNLVTNSLSITNAYGAVDTFQLWESEQAGLGAITVIVS